MTCILCDSSGLASVSVGTRDAGGLVVEQLVPAVALVCFPWFFGLEAVTWLVAKRDFRRLGA